MSKIAIVILNYNGFDHLRQFLPSVVAYSESADIIVADNASTDESVSWLKTNHPNIKIIQLDKNYGFCEGYNRALGLIKHEYSVLLNSDVAVSHNWLSPLAKALDHDKNLAAVQPKILSYSNKQKFEYAGAAGGFIDKMGYPFCRGRLFDTSEEDIGQYNQPARVFWTSGACMMIRTNLFKELGGFDPDFFAHMEEIDLCWRLQRAGYHLLNLPSSIVFHLGAGTLPKHNPRKTYLNFRNNLDLISRHWTTKELLIKLPIRIVMDWSAAGLFLFNGIPLHSLAVFRAQIHFLTRIRSILKKRRQLNLKLPKPQLSTIYDGMITVDFFLKGKRKFSELKLLNQ
jgi:GT2 family glycosyltransferase